MNNLCFKPFLYATSLALSLAFNAQAYTVEMIVFESNNPSLWLTENWPALPEKLDNTESDVIIGTAGTGRQLLSESQLSLKETARRLTSSGEFSILTHIGWTQAAETRESAKYGRIPDELSRNGLPVEAKVKLFKQKFEHITLEMQCTKKIPEAVATEFANKQQLPLSVIEQQWRFRLQEARKVKLNELQYFDHPMCGVLLMIRP